MDILTRNFDLLRLKQENLSGNAANVTTPGYKYQKLIQSTLAGDTAYNHRGGANGNRINELGSFVSGNQVDDSVRLMKNGSLQETGSPTDFAIMGDGFFTVDGPNGVLYTKNGQFSVNDEGQLMTEEGYIVQTTEDVFFNDGARVDRNGYINGTNAQFDIRSFPNNLENLELVDHSYFTSAEAAQTTDDISLYQGYIESSNVDMADIMVEMMEISREYEANQKVLQAANETLQKATNQIGKV